jgi:hypothetical protein
VGQSDVRIIPLTRRNLREVVVSTYRILSKTANRTTPIAYQPPIPPALHPRQPPLDDSPRHLQDLGHMVHHRQRSPSVLPLPEVEHGDDGGLPVLGRVAGDDGLHLFSVFFVELEGDLCCFVLRCVISVE